MTSSETSPAPKSSSRWIFSILAVITLAGFALRSLNVTESLWLDELHTGWVVKDAWSEVDWRARIGNQSPVWFYAVKLVTTTLGESEMTLRLLSMLAGTALMPLAYFVVLQACGQKPIGTRSVSEGEATNSLADASGFDSVAIAGLLAAALVAVDRNFIFYATEARPYACLQLVALLQLACFLKNLREPTTASRVSWIVLTGLSFHLHYTGILIVLGEVFVVLGYYLFSRERVPYRPWRAMFDWQVAIMLCLPALPHILEVGGRRQMWSGMTETPDFDALSTLFPLWQLTAMLIVASLLVMGTTSIAKLTRQQWVRSGLTIALCLIVPVLAARMAAGYELAGIFNRRYLIAFAIGPILLTGILFAAASEAVHGFKRGRLISATAATLLVAAEFYSSGIIEQFRYDGRAIADRDEDWRGAIAWMNQHITKDTVVLLDSGLIEERSGILGSRKFSHHSNSVLLTAHESQYHAFALNSLYPLVQRNSRVFSAFELLNEADLDRLEIYPKFRAKSGYEKVITIDRSSNTTDIRLTPPIQTVLWHRNFRSIVGGPKLRESFGDVEVTVMDSKLNPSYSQDDDSEFTPHPASPSPN